MVDKLTPLGENGTLENETTFEEWVDNGWVAERVKYSRLNRQLFRGDSKINEIIDNFDVDRQRGRQTLKDGYGDADHVTKIYTSEKVTGTLADSASSYTIGDMRDITNAIVAEEKKIIIATGGELEIKVFDVATEAVESTVTLPSTSLPDSNVVWETREVICDASWAYVVVYNTDSGAPTENHLRMQSYSLADWTANPSWPAEGVALYDASSYGLRADAIFADVGKIAYVDAADTGGNGLLYILDSSDGSVLVSGTGAQASVVEGPIATDGTFIYTANGTKIQISNPIYPSSGNNWPLSYATTAKDVAVMGDIIVHTYDNVGVDPLFVVSHRLQGSMADLSGGGDKLYVAGALCTDGESFYCRGARTPTGHSGEFMGTLTKLNPHAFSGGRQTGDTETVTTVENHIQSWSMSYGDVVAASSNVEFGAVIFDGRDLWGTWSGYTTGDDKLWRLHYAADRGVV